MQATFHAPVALAFLAASFMATTSHAQAPTQDSCRDVLVYAAKNYMSRFNSEERKAWVYAHKCSSASSNTSAGLDIIVEAIPIGASFNKDTQKKWCEENKRLDSYQAVAQAIDITVSTPALQNWSSCMEAHARQLGAKVRVSGNDAVIQIILTNRTPSIEKITGVALQSDERGGIACSPLPLTRERSLPIQRDVTIDCVRSYVTVKRQGKDYQLMPGGTISVSTSLTPILYSFPERFKEEKIPEVIPERLALSLKGVHVGTRAYWASRTRNTLFKCSNAVKPPNENYELVELGTTEERVSSFGNPRGRCGKPPNCDSHNEECWEVYYTNACYINKAWHDWYKAISEKQRVPYSKEAVCGT
jgi:hypothetical protein